MIPELTAVPDFEDDTMPKLKYDKPITIKANLEEHSIKFLNHIIRKARIKHKSERALQMWFDLKKRI